ncbi:hypothetical protein RF11_08867 [Thelohanellus kitauei]|uniref:Uncharacterized protein n=1 Tax=Thelohanellus kitauei TaxID=669202 RepID=A0A0C2NB82_THEKT|nr:hypothetical protein RF11_08867 [Thelohanellus kitauei]
MVSDMVPSIDEHLYMCLSKFVMVYREAPLARGMKIDTKAPKPIPASDLQEISDDACTYLLRNNQCLPLDISRLCIVQVPMNPFRNWVTFDMKFLLLLNKLILYAPRKSPYADTFKSKDSRSIWIAWWSKSLVRLLIMALMHQAVAFRRRRYSVVQYQKTNYSDHVHPRPNFVRPVESARHRSRSHSIPRNMVFGRRWIKSKRQSVVSGQRVNRRDSMGKTSSHMQQLADYIHEVNVTYDDPFKNGLYDLLTDHEVTKSLEADQPNCSGWQYSEGSRTFHDYALTPIGLCLKELG